MLDEQTIGITKKKGFVVCSQIPCSLVFVSMRLVYLSLSLKKKRLDHVSAVSS